MKKKKSKATSKAAPKAKAKSKAAIKAKGATRRAARPAAKKPQMASRRVKRNEVRSDRSLKSSLGEPVILAPEEDVAGLEAGQAGDLQGVSRVQEADSQSVEQLLEDGQAYEAEVIEGVEHATDEQPVPRRGRRETEGEPPADYGSKDRL